MAQIIKITQKGNFSKTKKNLKCVGDILTDKFLDKVCKETIEELERNSPYESIANSWYYKISRNKEVIVLSFNNTKTNKDVNIAVLVNIGHVNVDGHWIEGKHYIEEPIENAYNKIVNKMKEG